MRELINGIIFIFGGGLTLSALLTTLIFLLPERLQRTQILLETSPKRAFGIGLVNFIFFGLLAAFGFQRPQLLRLLAVFITLALSGLGAMGLAAVLHLLRQRIYEHHTLAETLKTAVLLVAAGLTPIVGWFVLTPIIFITGLGAVIITFIRPSEAAAPPDEPDRLPY